MRSSDVSWPDLVLPPINLLSFGREDSPCQGTCKLSGDECTGCHRTIDEITDWGIYEPHDRLLIIQRVYREDPTLRKPR